MELTSLSLEKRLILIIQQLLKESGHQFTQRKITLEDSLYSDLGIDSLAKAELLVRIEKAFDIKLSDNTLEKAKSLKDVVEAIANASPAIKHALNIAMPVLEKPDELPIDLSPMTTLPQTLFLYAAAAPERPHIYFQDEDGSEKIITYGLLLDQAKRVAGNLLKEGVAAGDTVAIMLPTQPGFFYAFFGILLAGGVPVPIYPPHGAHQIESYVRQEEKILTNSGARMLVTFDAGKNISRLLHAFIPTLEKVMVVEDLLEGPNDTVPLVAHKEDLALIQYTSGSTNDPKGVALSHQNLIANIRAYGEAMQITPSDVVVSWLPLYHDLGLIGMWLGSLYYGIPLILFSPLTFLNRPEKWLWAIHYYRGTVSAGPNFAYALCTRKIDPAAIEGLNLSTWRLAINGAEPISYKTLEEFHRKFSSYGFKFETFTPVYGLAESCLGVTASVPEAMPKIDAVERKAFEEEKRAIPMSASTQKTALDFVCCGKALPGHEIRVTDQHNNVLPERSVGQLQFKGPSGMQGYYRNPEATRAVYHDGWYDTGDMAYIVEGEVYITGRKKDLIIKLGRNLYPAEIEQLVGQVDGIKPGCVVAFGVTERQHGTEKLVVVAELRDNKVKDQEQIIKKTREVIVSALDVAPDDVLLVPPRTIPKTSSGKLKRAACKAAYLKNTLSQYNQKSFWRQLCKLGLQWAAIKFNAAVMQLVKLFYTSYVALLLVVTVLPVWLILHFVPQKIAMKLCKLWAKTVIRLSFCPVEIHKIGEMDYQKPAVYIANHASYIDALLLLSVLPTGVRYISKKELAKVPIIKTFFAKLGHIYIDRVDYKKSLHETEYMIQLVKEGGSLFMFPEGTFTGSSGLRPFKLGAFKIAAEANVPACAIALQGTRALLRDKAFLFTPGRIKVTLMQPIQAHGKTWEDITRMKDHAHAEIAKYCGEPSLDMITAGSPEVLADIKLQDAVL